jgi:DNA-binding beta-propeller fold protein YncE/4-amino-4-deoxy-L-arabinose transferase-like glycosyltransferase
MKADSISPENKLAYIRTLWASALVVSFLLSIFATFRGGYVGPDYNMHLSRLLDPSKIFDSAATSPPTYYLLGHALFLLIGPNNAFPITLSITQVTINVLAMWWFFRYTERRFNSPLVHLGLVFFLTFLPVRIIHAATIGPDSMTIPLFVLVLFLFDNFRTDETSTPQSAALLGLALGAAVWVKYSFMALIPTLFVVFVFLWASRRWKWQRFFTICLLSLSLASALSIHSFWASSRLHGYNTEKHWLPKGGSRAQPEMDYKDLLSVKTADLQLFEAPEMFKHEPSDGQHYDRGFRVAHKDSYLGLSHMGVFTDTMNLFQELPGSQSIDRYLIPDFKIRRPWKTRVMVASMSLGTLWTLLALIGTPLIFLGALKHLYEDKLLREDVLVFLGGAYFLLMFLPIPFVNSSVVSGYWTPRLILPPLLCFFCAAFLLIDKSVARSSKTIAGVLLALVIIQSAIEIVMLAPTVADEDLSEPPVTAFQGGVGTGKGQFDTPRGIAIDSAGNIFVADTGNKRIEKFSPTGTFLSIIGAKGSGQGQLADPNGIAIDRSGNIYVAEISSKHRVQKLGPGGTFIAAWAPGLYGPRKIAIGPDDSIYVVDSGRNRIVKFSPNGQVLASWGSDGSGDGQFKGLSSVAVDPTTDRVYVADPLNRRIQAFDSNGKFLTKWSVPEWGQPLGFEDLAIDPDRDRLYASSAHMNIILVFDLQGNRIGTLAPTPPDKLEGPSGLALAKDKPLVLNAGSARVSVIDLQNR